MSKRRIFRRISAWFSTSVDKRYKDHWVENGGTIVNTASKAQFIFSSDPEASDLKSLYNLDEFEDGYVALKPTLIDAALQEGDAHEVMLSSFILHPTEVNKAMNAKKRKMMPPGQGRPVDGLSLRAEEPSTSENIVFRRELTPLDMGRMMDLVYVPHVKDVPRFDGNLEDLFPEYD
ncbi:telomere repeats-binding bouquet formation protein 2-like [Anneissia japonica]|uniref:telomere repeats-binding bouquet formation protein 2-like n=1 Tax=Anneissia japonica TaxID=1529436 RepID=UPI0014256326|nr:telomere repeats-binding bouquet formation protein 2-like [Anneissia japonica]